MGFFLDLLRLVGVKMRLSKTICVGLLLAIYHPLFAEEENHLPVSVHSGYTICASRADLA